MKPIEWIGSSVEAVRGFPEIARQHVGYQLYRVQTGLDPTGWKPLSSIGAGVREIRIHVGDEYRVIYVAAFEEAVYVLHALQNLGGHPKPAMCGHFKTGHRKLALSR